jgi:hypothetical protein
MIRAFADPETECIRRGWRSLQLPLELSNG